MLRRLKGREADRRDKLRDSDTIFFGDVVNLVLWKNKMKVHACSHGVDQKMKFPVPYVGAPE